MRDFPSWGRGRLFVISKVTHRRRVIIFGSARQRLHDPPETERNRVHFLLYSSRYTIVRYASDCPCRLVCPLAAPFSALISYKSTIEVALTWTGKQEVAPSGFGTRP